VATKHVRGGGGGGTYARHMACSPGGQADNKKISATTHSNSQLVCTHCNDSRRARAAAKRTVTGARLRACCSTGGVQVAGVGPAVPLYSKWMWATVGADSAIINMDPKAGGSNWDLGQPE
jgi:hypothetical protein